VAASPNTGVNTLAGEGLADALVGAPVVIDVSNSPSFEDSAVMRFFETSTRNLLAAEAGVAHHVALSVVGDERLPESGYFRAKIAQEQLIEKSSIPYSIVHATQFFEFVGSIADAYSNAAPAASPNGPRRSPSASSHATSTRSPVSGAGPESLRIRRSNRPTARTRRPATSGTTRGRSTHRSIPRHLP
jgi:uncharacterized protein YbjT (DUF2867 family)